MYTPGQAKEDRVRKMLRAFWFSWPIVPVGPWVQCLPAFSRLKSILGKEFWDFKFPFHFPPGRIYRLSRTKEPKVPNYFKNKFSFNLKTKYPKVVENALEMCRTLVSALFRRSWATLWCSQGFSCQNRKTLRANYCP